MLDIALLAFIGFMLLMGLKRPFLWVLTYIYIDLVMPQKIGWGIITSPSLKLSLVAFVAAFGGWLLLDSKQGARFSARQGMIVLLLAWCLMTTFGAEFQQEAWEKWAWVWKALVFAAFLPLTLRTRLRIEAAALFIVLAVGTIAINGGIKTMGGGGGYGALKLLVNDNAGIYEGSIISTAAIAIIPLALWLARHGTIFKPDWKVWTFTGALIFACLLIPVGTSARTGLVCAAVLGVLLLRSVRYRFVYMGAASLALMAAVPFLPASFTERMGTINEHEGDQSASTRVAVWKWTIEYAKDHPLGGGFDAYRSNSFTYQTRAVTGTGPSQQVEYQTVTESGRAYHSSYFELLGEQGYLGLALWLVLQALGLWHMERLRWRFGKRSGRDGPDATTRRASWQWGLASALQQAHLVYLVGAAFVGIAYQPFLFMLVGLQCALWSYVQRTEAPERKAWARRPEGAGPVPQPAQ